MARVGKYVITGELGRGDGSIVYGALDPVIGRQVAVKTVPRSDPAQVARLQRQAQAAGVLHHTHIAAIYEYGEQEAEAWIAMEMVQGRTLREHLAGGYRAAVDPLAPLVVEVLEALDHAHATRVYHGDLRAENVLVTAGGHAKLIGFRGEGDERADLRAVVSLLNETLAQPLAAEHASARTMLNALRPHKSGIKEKLGALRRAVQAPAASTPRPAVKPSVLFVDEEERVLNALSALFQDAYDVEAVASSVTALKRMRQRRFHVICASEDLLREAKSIAPNAVRLLLTAHAEAVVGDADAFRVIAKPWQQAELKATLAVAADAAIAVEARQR